MTPTNSPQAEQQPPNRFRRGVSGNPAGRPKGAYSKLGILRRTFAEKQAPFLLDLLIGQAANDPQAARWLADRIIGPGPWYGEAIPAIGPLLTIEDCAAEGQALFAAHAAGEISSEALGKGLAVIDRRVAMIVAGSGGDTRETPDRAEAKGE